MIITIPTTGRKSRAMSVTKEHLVTVGNEHTGISTTIVQTDTENFHGINIFVVCINHKNKLINHYGQHILYTRFHNTVLCKTAIHFTTARYLLCMRGPLSFIPTDYSLVMTNV